MKYRQKPVVVDAFQITAENHNNPKLWPNWAQDKWRCPRWELHDLKNTIAYWDQAAGTDQAIKGVTSDLLMVHNRDLAIKVIDESWILLFEDGHLETMNAFAFEDRYEACL